MSKFNVRISGDRKFMSNDALKKISGGVCAAKGFRAAALHCGIKRIQTTKDDLALIVSDFPTASAGTFTTNQVKAAPVLVSQEFLRTGKVRGVILNSGNANACTGAEGIQNAKAMAQSAADALGLPTTNQILVCSTGRIGVQMPIQKITPQIPRLVKQLSRSKSLAAAKAIMTSDSFPKQSAYTGTIEKKSFKIGGIAKGAGMINPQMATMLCVITTDLAAPPKVLQKLLREAVETSFNRITVDGDTSTNDTVLLLANGASGMVLDEGNTELFECALRTTCLDLARQIVGDGEGTTKVIELTVRGARSNADARLAAQSVGNSILLKCAWAGADPNWGRILDALGYSQARINPERVDVYYEEIPLVLDGQPAPNDAKAVKKIAEKKSFRVTIDLHLGNGEYTLLTTDLTEEFVRLNLSE